MIEMTEQPQENTKLEPKTPFKARVMKVSLAGAVLDIGIGKPALLHVSQIAVPENIQNKKVDEILKVGDEIDVWVKRVTRKDGEERIEMTMIKPLDLEWREIKVGETVKGKVVRLEKFGAFVEIMPGKDGLVHISQLADYRVNNVEDICKIGDIMTVKCIGIDDRGKIKLSRKEVLKEQQSE